MVQAIQEFDFGEHTCSINRYIQKRMPGNGISKIINMERIEISPAVRSLLQDYQPTTASVEISFSTMRKVFARIETVRSKM